MPESKEDELIRILEKKLDPEQLKHIMALTIARSPSQMQLRSVAIFCVLVVSCVLVLASIGVPMFVHDVPKWTCLLGALMGGGFLFTCLSMLDGQRPATGPFLELARSISIVMRGPLGGRAQPPHSTDASSSGATPLPPALHELPSGSQPTASDTILNNDSSAHQAPNQEPLP